MKDVRIIGIRPVVDHATGRPTGSWAVVGERTDVRSNAPGDYDSSTVRVLVSEHDNKRGAIIASGTNRVIA